MEDIFGIKGTIGNNNCGPTFGPIETREKTVLENLESERENLIERLKKSTEAILLIRANPEFGEIYRKLMQSGAY